MSTKNNKATLTNTATNTESLQLRIAELSAVQELSIRKIEKYSAMFGEISNLLSNSGLPDRITFRVAITNWRTIGALIEAIFLIIKRFKSAQ